MKTDCMKKINIFLFCLIMIGLVTANILTPERYFSQNENRILASRPEFNMEDLLKGKFGSDYESYITDQFAGRDSWIKLKNYSELALQKKELNGVYLAKDGSLIEKHDPTRIDGKKAEIKADRLAAATAGFAGLLGSEHVKIMLVPTADVIRKEKLPSFAAMYDQLGYLELMQSKLSAPDMLIPVHESLIEHQDEYIYYKTDHHWTSLGAYYAYWKWAECSGWTAAEQWNVKSVSDNFLGTLHSKINLDVAPDRIDVYERPYSQPYRVEYIYEDKVADSLYDMSKLDTKDQYAVFLGGNFPLVSIETGVENSKSLLLIKDSYANSFIPFAAEHFEVIYVLDPRYYRADAEKLIQEKEVTDVLILYDIIHFIENY